MDELFRAAFNGVFYVGLMGVVFYLVVKTNAKLWAKILVLGVGYGEGILLLSRYIRTRPVGFPGELTLQLAIGFLVVSTISILCWLRVSSRSRKNT